MLATKLNYVPFGRLYEAGTLELAVCASGYSQCVSWWRVLVVALVAGVVEGVVGVADGAVGEVAGLGEDAFGVVC